MESRDEETLELRETYTSLQQEVDIKTKKLKKVDTTHSFGVHRHTALLLTLYSDVHSVSTSAARYSSGSTTVTVYNQVKVHHWFVYSDCSRWCQSNVDVYFYSRTLLKYISDYTQYQSQSSVSADSWNC